MAKTENIGLNLTEDDSTKFSDWRKSIDGKGTGSEKSNMQLIDEAIGDLKSQGVKGDKGDDGYTPVRGVDYWTPEDKVEIAGFVESEIEKNIGDINTALEAILGV